MLWLSGFIHFHPLHHPFSHCMLPSFRHWLWLTRWIVFYFWLAFIYTHRATFSHHETQYVRRVFMQIIPQNLKTPQKTSKHLQKPDGRMSKRTILSLYNITKAWNLDKIIDFFFSVALSCQFVSCQNINLKFLEFQNLCLNGRKWSCWQ